MTEEEIVSEYETFVRVSPFSDIRYEEFKKDLLYADRSKSKGNKDN